MSDHQYRAYIVLPGGHEDPLQERAMLSVVRQVPRALGQDILRMTDKGWFWEPISEGDTVVKPSLEMPGPALTAVIEAVHRLEGYRPGAEQVLREWLKSERDRSDSLLDLIVKGAIPRWELVDLQKQQPMVIGTAKDPRKP